MKKFISLFVLTGLVLFLALRTHRENPSSAEGRSNWAYAQSVLPEVSSKPQVTIPTKIESTHSASVGAELNPKQNATINEFRDFLKESYTAMPTVETLSRDRVKDAHHIDPRIAASSTIFGAIAEKIKQNPVLIPSALAFYLKCGRNEDFPSPMRGVCVRNLEDWAKVAGMRLTKTDIPPAIQTIADSLPRH